MVLAGPPNRAERVVARPSPVKVLCSPGFAMKFEPTVEEIAEISPICSIMVASDIGTIAITELITKEELLQSMPPNTVLFHFTGIPIHGAFFSWSNAETENNCSLGFPNSVI